MPTYVRLLPLALLTLVACSSGGDDKEDAGTPLVEDLCNSREEALSLAECELKPGVALERLLVLEGEKREGDQDWYRIVLPANTSARTLLNVNGAYLASSTAVQLSITILGPLADGKEGALAKKDDKHGQGAPRPVDMVVPLRDDLAGKTLLVLVQDAPDVVSQPKFDARNPYRLTMTITENPDAHEPNDLPTAATPLALGAGTDGLVATTTGYLATDNDVDRYTFDLAEGKVAYVRVTAPDQGFVPNWRLSYQLLRPGFLTKEEKEDEGEVRPQVRPGVLATARKVKAGRGGKWMLVVRGYRGISDRDTAAGDIRQPYEVEIRVLDEKDPQDVTLPGNDTVATAFGAGLDGTTPGTPQAVRTFEGRLAYLADQDWYSVRLPASTVPTRLRYQLTPLATGGRFPALPDTPDRQVLVFRLVTTAGNLDDWRNTCLNDSKVCPKGFSENPDMTSLVRGFCERTDLPAPMCLHSLREEAASNPVFANLSNFVGVLPVPAHTDNITYYFLVQDDGTDWADDKDYRLTVSWLEEDADEVGRYVSGTEQPVVRTLASTSAFPSPPDTAEFSVSGKLSHGFGRLRNGEDRVNGRGVRGPMDYDAVPSDVDSYEFTLPDVPAPEDRAWLVQWEVEKVPDSGTPHGLALDLTFCDGDATADGGVSDGGCVAVKTGSRNQSLTLGYRSDALRAWHTPANASVNSLMPLYTLEERPNSTVVTLAPYACGCLEPRFIRGKKMRVDVSAAERTSYESVNYTLRTAYAPYPQKYTLDGGTEVSCPMAGADAGTPDGGGTAANCVFTRQP
ncbi:hypothetical protein LZ198_39880 [Myxococcus sp. K15C18031901]|uniref:hypothetical protein n=1 Tax=Myxococcus dinghuensis TaxID=2906761 RepID=UPI0020A71680|nr:hypothetical protein [Myxococcus dinghuensis]MCP3105044.1 hypothetical protein [Myxococcus dinghuensis]